jgi:ABC-type amino acid transport substrate-binding protein
MIDVDKMEVGSITNHTFYILFQVSNVIFELVKSIEEQGRASLPGPVPDGKLDTTTALIYDSVTAFAIALDKLDTVQQVRQQQLDCSGEKAWEHGNSLVNYMKMVEFIGLSGKIEFDTSGLRTQFELDLMELQLEGLSKVGSWNSLDKLSLSRVEKDSDGGSTLHAMSNKSFVITSILNPPYTMLVEKAEKLSGNARFEGFAIDLATELSKILNFNFTFKIVDDGKYGGESSPGNWNGMLGEVHNEVADFCIADISITSSRAAAFTFSMPWLNLGISILYIPPRSAPPSLLAFLDPFTTDVYIYTLLVFVLVTLIIYVLARFSPNQWEEPPNCVKDPEEYENQYTFLNSFWFTLGALMQQGSDVAPIALCVRFAAGMWFFFALIMIASYTANLAAFLTVETLERPIESVEDLANQNEIWYGAVNGGSTSKFFLKSENDVYQRLNQFMTGVHTGEVMMDSNDDGVDKVEGSKGKYAFFMESASIEYLVERRCNLSQVGGLLDSKGYGIATRHGTPYKPLLDWGILQLQEGGVLHRLKVKWWKQKRGGGACAGRGGGGGVSPLGLGNVAGVFLVTMAGCTIAAIFAVLEFLYGTRQSAQDAGVTWLEEMTNELKFIFQVFQPTNEWNT